MGIALMRNIPDAVRAELARRDIDEEDIARLLDVRDGDSPLLTGSYTLGEANPTSDLDFLILCLGQERERLRFAGTTNHPSTFGDSFDGQIKDLVVNVEYVGKQRLEDLCQLLDKLNGSGTSMDLPNLQMLELRLVQRLSTGVSLVTPEPDWVDRMRQRIDAEAVRASAAALAFVMCLSQLEDTLVLESPARELMCRGAGMTLLVSGLNGHGPITYNHKHIWSRAGALAATAGMPKLFAECERLIFIDRLPVQEARELVLDLAVNLYRSFSAPHCPSLILPMLEPFLSQWAWAGRSFES